MKPMTTIEFLIEKNQIVYDVTKVILVPEDQMEEVKRVPLPGNSGVFLSAEICPYCVAFEFDDWCYDCSECIMSKQDNECMETCSTWREASMLWQKLATEADHNKLANLIGRYNQQFEKEM